MLSALFGCSGRIGRLTYLLRSLLAWAGFYGALLLVFMIAWGGALSVGLTTIQGSWVTYAALGIALLCGWAICALMGKRLRDLGIAGWHTVWVVLLCVAALYASGAVPILGIVLGAAAAAVFLLLLVVPGARDPNAFGPPPA